MESEILFVICPLWDIKHPAIGIAYISSYLRSKGIKTKVYDANIELYHKVDTEKKAFWTVKTNFVWKSKDLDKYVKEVSNKILSMKSKVISFVIMAPNQEFSYKVMERIKKQDPEKIIITGGAQAPSEDSKYIDYHVLGEAETTMYELIKQVEHNKFPEDVKGLVIYNNKKSKNKIITTEERKERTDLNLLPFPTYEEFKLDKYSSKGRGIIGSRGCINKCAYCNDWSLWKKYNFRKADSIFEEIKFHYNKYHTKEFEFFDLMLNGNIRELNILCDLIISSEIKIIWHGSAIIRKEMTIDLLKKMKKSGCCGIIYGLESGSDKVIRLMGKSFSSELAEKVIRNTNEAGIGCGLNMIVGFPGETEKDFDETIKFIKRNHKYIGSFPSIATCFAIDNSILEKKSEEFGIDISMKNHWYNWESKDKQNNNKIRSRRARKLASLIKRYNIPISEVKAVEDKKDDKNRLLKLIKKISKKEDDDIESGISLINCPPWGIERPPLGLGIISESLKRNGIKTDIFDLNLDLYKQISEENKLLWDMNYHERWILEFEKVKKEITDFDRLIDVYKNNILNTKNEFVGFSIASPKGFFAIELIKALKNQNKDLKIIIGGPMVSTIEGIKFFNEKIPTLIDYFIVGRAEETLKELILKQIKLKKIKGLIVNSHKKDKIDKKVDDFNKKNKDINNIEFVYPKYEGFKLKKYARPESLDIEWSRGCISNCSFCSVRALNGTYKSKNPKTRFEEIKYHYKKNGIRNFSIVDSTINGNIKHLEETCNLIIDSGIKINWSGQIIPRKEMTLELFQKMKKAGCNRLEFGIESGSNKVLRLMKKINDAKISENNLKFCKQAGIQTVTYFIIGFPGETEEDFTKTLIFLEKSKDHIDLVRSFRQIYLTHGSDMTNNPNKYGIKVNNDDMGVKWETKDNNFTIRMKRINTMKNKLDKLKIKYELFDQEEVIGDTDIMLVNPPPWGIEDPPTGLSYISTYLKSKGINVSCYDMNIKFYNSSDERLRSLWHVENKNFWKNKNSFNTIRNTYLKQINDAVHNIIKNNPKIVAINIVDPKERITIELIKIIKERKPETKIILGGPGASSEDGRSWFTKNIPEMVDGYIVGEGEQTLYEVTKELLNNKNIDNVPGIMTFRKGKYNKYKPRQLLSIKKEHHWPTYEEFDLNEYHSDALRVEWSRGCISNCVFCKGKVLNPGYRFRSPKDIVDELEYHSKRNNLRKFIVVDLTVNGDPKKLEQTCELIIKRKLKIEWMAQGIPRKELTYSLLNKMKKSGCYELQLGVESGSDKVLKLMKKRHTANEAEKCIKKVHKAGINLGLFIIVGFPGETKKDFKLTLDFITRNRESITYIKSINALHLIDETDLLDNSGKHNLIIPTKSGYYLWKTKDGNDWTERKRRMREMYVLLRNLNIPLVETNYDEGKEKRKNQNIITNINQLQDLQMFTNLGITEIAAQGNPIKLFFECLREHGLKYTIDHTRKHIKKLSRLR